MIGEPSAAVFYHICYGFVMTQEVVKTLEEKRKAKDREYYEQKKKANVRLCMCIWTG